MISFPTDGIPGAKLPTGVMLCAFSFSIVDIGALLRESLHSTYEELIKIWGKCRLPVRSKRDIMHKIESLYMQQQQRMKSKQRSNRSDVKKQEEYSIKLDKLFDIAHANADSKICLTKTDSERKAV